MDTVIYKSSALTLTFTDASIQTASGTTTSWLPVITPWTGSPSCSTEVYAQPDHDAILFDPYYQTSVVPGANTAPCLPPEATAWWDQGADQAVLLGPTFVCPSAYSAVETLVVNSATQQTLCCPSNFGLYMPMTQLTKGVFPSQCTSMMSSGESYTYMTSTSGSWGSYTDHLKDDYTIYAIPVNGFNVQAKTTTSLSIASATNLVTSTSTTGITGFTLAPVLATTSNPQSTSSPPSKLSSDTTSPSPSPSPSPNSPIFNIAVGIGIGVGVGIVLLISACIPLYKLWKRRRPNPQGQIQYDDPEPSQQYENQLQIYHHQQQFQEAQPPIFFSEIDGAERVSAVVGCSPVFELSDKRQTDSWVKDMMVANQEELWMESPIR
ncbi:hypothetical protein SBOR_6342 [Sclerotinia borealis F-4128]|uniref:Uncharacterized protein n=1 Tax=Sclerotinia borealis (strain F-4128) TaxID=1432307 RepID=W9C900_SCLBF|nr:hypothetical protein SBOR_6342 [Sclerotinia borealis F-4128]